MRSEIYTVNTNSQTLSTGNVIALGNTIRRFGNNCIQVNDSIVTRGCGFYNIDATVIGTATADGLVTIAVYDNGTPIAGATASANVNAGDLVTLPISTVARVMCGCGNASLTLVMTGVAGTLSNVSFRVFS